jgi:hypothetical protein
MFMFYIFREHNILPGQFYAMPTGEKLLLRAFVNELLDRQIKKPKPTEKSKIKMKGRR